MKNYLASYIVMILGVLSISIGYFRFVSDGFNLKVAASIFAGIMVILMGWFLKKKLKQKIEKF